MHIPDGILATPVWLTLNGVSAAGVAWLARQAQRQTPESRIPLLGVMSAFVFAAQMINFPVGLGTSGHLLGAALLAITLGPAAAALAMTAILILQALVFQDGGVLALGANVFNMALAGVLAGYGVYAATVRTRWRSAGIVAAGWVSVLVSAALAVSELVLSGVRPPTGVVWAAFGLFLINGCIEGAATLAVVRGLERIGPGFVEPQTEVRKPVFVAMGAAAVGLAAGGVFLASEAPDVLEDVLGRTGIAEGAGQWLRAPLADYQAPLASSPGVARAAAGLLGILLIYIAGRAATRILIRRRKA